MFGSRLRTSSIQSQVNEMSEKKPKSLFPERTVTRCPVCQEPTYSSCGIHPQCAVKRADEPRRLALVADRKMKKANKESQSNSENSGVSQ